MFNADTSFPPSVAVLGPKEYEKSHPDAPQIAHHSRQCADSLVTHCGAFLQLHFHPRRAFACANRELDHFLGSYYRQPGTRRAALYV